MKLLSKSIIIDFMLLIILAILFAFQVSAIAIDSKADKKAEQSKTEDNMLIATESIDTSYSNYKNKLSLLQDNNILILNEVKMFKPIQYNNVLNTEKEKQKVKYGPKSYIEEEKLDEKDYQTKYVSVNSLRIRKDPSSSKDDNIIGELNKNDTVTVIKFATDTRTKEKWAGINYEGKIAYISYGYLSDEKVGIDPEDTYNHTWTGETLNRSNGVCMGPNGKESYYNLNMSGVISIMRGLGYSEEEYPYWVRDDGVKMFGEYVMTAADLSVYPKGTIVETSLGLAIVCDTGGFVYSTDRAFDIAVSW